jgi:putative transposase
VPVEVACQLIGMSRATYYRPAVGREPDAQATTLRDRIEEIVLEFAGYGYRRVTETLQREGFCVNHKRVLRIMREESLLCQLRQRWVRTTDSDHGLRTYPNLLANRGWRRLTGVNQAWAADITYIRLAQGFAYLAAILDAYSRRVVGWAFSRQIDAALAVAALEMALETRQPPVGWIHHSDRGVQYACREYVAILERAGAQISMAAKGTPREYAQCWIRRRSRHHDTLGRYATADLCPPSLRGRAPGVRGGITLSECVCPPTVPGPAR